MGDPGARLAEAAHLAGVEVDAVGEPHVRPEPAQILQVLDRAHAEALEAELLLVLRLGEVRVQPHARRRASSAVSAISSPVTEKGEQGASAMRVMASGAGSWKASMAASEAARIASRSSTISSGGRPPRERPRSIEPRQGWKRTPRSRAASISTARRSPAPRGKT